MQGTYLYRALPFLEEMEEDRRRQFELYFKNAPVWLIESFRFEDMEKGTVFVREGAPADSVFFIISGTIKATDYRFQGIVYDFMRFDKVYAMGGMEVLMDLQHYGTSLETVTRCKVLKIPRSKFEKWLFTDMAALKYEAKLMGEYLLEQGRISRAYLFLQGSDRLAMLLAERYERYAKEGLLRMSGDRQSLSDSTGLCVKTINRAVKKFGEEGLIGREKSLLLVDKRQYESLRRMVQEKMSAGESCKK